MAPFRVHVEVEGDGEYGEEHNQQDPGDFDIGIPGPVNDNEGHDQAHQHGSTIYRVVPQSVESQEEQAELGGQEKDYHGGAAKNQAEKSPFSLVQQQDGLLVQMVFLLLAHGSSYPHS